MNARKNVIALASVALLAAPVLAACGSSSTEETSASASPSVESVAPTPTPTPTETGPLVGGDPSTWTPEEVTMAMNGEKVKIVVGQFAVFTDLPAEDADNKIVLRAKKKGIVDITQATKTSSAGFSGLAPGRTRITVWDGKPKDKDSLPIMYIIVKVKEAPVSTG